MGDTYWSNGIFNFKVDCEKREELHLLLVAEYEGGYVTLYSKRLPGGDIFYKMSYQEGEDDEVLHEGEIDPAVFNKLVEDYETEVLKPAGSNWQEIKPFTILQEKDGKQPH
ncbi:MAG TPA: hypothetical protein GX697_03775 [Firmicutes bacterium]|nr:hypothetical protein [Bacillota bacterium]